MSSTFSNLKFELIGSGEQAGIWGTTTNTNIGTAIEQAIAGMATLNAGDFTANVATLVLANTNTAQDARALCLNIDAGALSAAGTLNVPAIQKPYVIINNALFALTVKVSGQPGVTVPAGKRTVVYNDGTDVGEQVSFLTSLVLGTALPIDSGGTGASNAADARNALDAQQTLVSGSNIQTINGNSILGSGNLVVTSPTATPTTLGLVYGRPTAAFDNISYGYDAMSASAGSLSFGANLAVGKSAMGACTVGSQNTALGHFTIGTCSGSGNTVVGYTAGFFAGGCSNNTFVGRAAGYQTTTGSNNVCIGYGAEAASATVSNTVTLGNSSITTLRCQVTTITSLSDARDKTHVQTLDKGLELLRAINPVHFVWNMRDGAKVGVEDTGFIAQNLKSAQLLTGVDIPGLVDETNPDKLEAGYGKLIPVLVSALKQLDAEFQAYKLAHP